MSQTIDSRIESQYVFRERYPERGAVYRRFDQESRNARRTLRCLLDMRYGDGAREVFDLFPGLQGSPLLVFVHGGYWHSQSKARFSFVASAMVNRGFSVALPNYPLAPDVPVTSSVESVRKSVPAIIDVLKDIGYSPPCWIASGHSAGGHMAAMLSLTDWSDRIDLPLSGCVPISGIFDLTPLIKTSLNTTLRLDEAEAVALSPSRISQRGGPMTAVVGAAETQAFIAQSETYVRHWQACGARSRLALLVNLNHYTILGDLLENRSRIADVICSHARVY